MAHKKGQGTSKTDATVTANAWALKNLVENQYSQAISFFANGEQSTTQVTMLVWAETLLFLHLLPESSI